MSAKASANVPRLALSVEEACTALGCSWDFFAAHVAPDLPVVRRGRRKLIPVAAIERWLAESAEQPLANGIGTRRTAESPVSMRARASRAPVDGAST